MQGTSAALLVDIHYDTSILHDIFGQRVHIPVYIYTQLLDVQRFKYTQDFIWKIW